MRRRSGAGCEGPPQDLRVSGDAALRAGGPSPATGSRTAVRGPRGAACPLRCRSRQTWPAYRAGAPYPRLRSCTSTTPGTRTWLPRTGSPRHRSTRSSTRCRPGTRPPPRRHHEGRTDHRAGAPGARRGRRRRVSPPCSHARPPTMIAWSSNSPPGHCPATDRNGGARSPEGRIRRQGRQRGPGAGQHPRRCRSGPDPLLRSAPTGAPTANSPLGRV